MARSDGYFKKGQVANPNGRPKGQTMRSAIKARLSQIDHKSGKTYYELWADSIVLNAISNEDKLDVIKFLEGATPLIKPSDDPLEDPQSHDANGDPVEP